MAAWLLTPDLLCLIPGVEMTAREHQCCEQMGGDCGQIPMPDMQTCCRSETPSPALVTARTVDYSELRSMMLPALMPELDAPDNSAPPRHWLRFESLIPPPLTSRNSFDILRI
jgi:hypothetical protein